MEHDDSDHTDASLSPSCYKLNTFVLHRFAKFVVMLSAGKVTKVTEDSAVAALHGL